MLWVMVNRLSTDARRPASVAVITGGAGGIGLATARLLARDGYNVVLMDRAGQHLARAAESVRTEGRDVLALACDVRNTAMVDLAIQTTIAGLGRMDVLVNTAAIARLGTIEDLSDKGWDSMLEVNLRGTFAACRAAHPHLVAAAPSAVVNVASISGRTRSVLTDPSYVASKAGVIGLTKSLAGQWAADGIRVNCVAPGLTDTAMAAVYTPEQRASFERTIPLGRYADPAEIAEAIVFLASPRASYITGAVLDVNGGMFMA